MGLDGGCGKEKGKQSSHSRHTRADPRSAHSCLSQGMAFTEPSVSCPGATGSEMTSPGQGLRADQDLMEEGGRQKGSEAKRKKEGPSLGPGLSIPGTGRVGTRRSGSEGGDS